MAGKHSKSIFDAVKDIFVLKKDFNTNKKSEMPLLFKMLAMVLVTSLVISLIFVGSYFNAGNKQRKVLANAKKQFEEWGANQAIKNLSEENQDIKGWININGTDISYAVCQSDDDKYYVNHNQIGQKSRYGALALSSTDNFERSGNDKNIVIFGNNMKDGTMFGSLKNYRNLNFYKQNAQIELYYGNKKEKYVIFSIMLVSSQNDDTGSVYNPAKSHFADEQDFDRWYQESCNRSLINTKITVKQTDDFLTLVTTANDFEGARLVVLAKKITRPAETNVNTEKAVVNGKIKYPKIWYTERGLEYPY